LWERKVRMEMGVIRAGEALGKGVVVRELMD
jgi:hypothetical protein